MMPDIKETLSFPNKKAVSLEGCKSYMLLGLPSIGLMCLDWWVFEIMAILAGEFGVEILASQIVIMNILGMTYRVGQGLDSAGCTLIGNAIGSGNVFEAKKVFKVFYIFSCFLIAFEVYCVYMFIEQLVSMYTNEEHIKRRALSLTWIICITQFPDSFKGPLKGTFKAFGMQYKAVYINLTGHWLLNMTLMWYFAFHLGWGQIGLLYSKLILEYYIFTMYNIVIFL